MRRSITLNFIVALLVVVVVGTIGCSSSDSSSQQGDTVKSNTETDSNRKPSILTIALAQDAIKPVFEKVHKSHNENLKQISDLTYQNIETNNVAEHCDEKADMIFVERSLSSSEIKNCKKQNFEPVDISLATVKSSGDTAFLYTNEMSLKRDEVRFLINKVAESMANQRTMVSRYNPADTGLLNRTKGLMFLHSN